MANPVAQTPDVKYLQIGQLTLFVSGRTNKNGSRARQVAITLRDESPRTERRVQVIAPYARRSRDLMRKDVREFIRRLESVGLTVESTPGHYHVLRDGKPLRKQNGMPFTLPFSPGTIRWRRAAIVELRKLGIELQHGARNAEARRPF